jgi:hypothetical protein
VAAVRSIALAMLLVLLACGDHGKAGTASCAYNGMT